MLLRNRLCLIALAAGASLIVAACGTERAPTAPANAPTAQAVSPASCTPAEVDAIMLAGFPDIDARLVMRQRFAAIVALKNGSGDKAPNLAGAQAAAINLVDFILVKFKLGRATGGTGPTGQANTAAIINGVLCFVGLPPFDPGALGSDGAAAVITPTSPRVTLVTPSLHAGVDVPSGGVPQPILLTITRLPNSPPPLLTQLDQYPLFYEFSYNPGITFTVPVTVGLCLPNDITAPDPSRLRLAHNIAPFTMGSIEILEPVGAGFVDCSNVTFSAAPSTGRLNDLARGGFNLLRSSLTSLVLPSQLSAATRKFGGAGLSGSVKTFSPFGGVDTLGIITPIGSTSKTSVFGGNVDFAPAVSLTTPTGAPMAGIPVTFAVTAGGGSLGATSVLTDANGNASSGSWTLGSSNPNTATATATATPRSGFLGNPVTFTGTGH